MYKIVALCVWHFCYWIRLNRCRKIQKNKIKNAIEQLQNKYFRDLPDNFEDQCDKIGMADMTEVQELLNSKKITSTILLKIYFRRAIDLGLKYNAITDFIVDEAFQKAEILDQERSLGRLRSELHGMPLSVKNNINVRGYDTSTGLVTRYGNLSIENDFVIDVLEDLGCIPFLKSNLPIQSQGFESENFIYGRTTNPLRDDISPGGSSGGESVLVLLGCSPQGLCSDNAGSARVPALNCGLSGIKYDAKRVCSIDNPTQEELAKVDFCFQNYGFITKSTRDLICASKALFESKIMYQNDKGLIYKRFDTSAFNPNKKLRVATLDLKIDYDISLANKNAFETAKVALEKKGHIVESINGKIGYLAEEVFNAKYCANTLLEVVIDRIKFDWTLNETANVKAVSKTPKWVFRVINFVFRKVFGYNTVSKHLDMFIYKLSDSEQLERAKKVRDFRDKVWNIMKTYKYDCLQLPSGYTPPLPLGYSKKMGILISWIMLPNIQNMVSGVLQIKNVEKFEENYQGILQDQDFVTSDIKKSLNNSTGLPSGVQINCIQHHEEYQLRAMADLESFLSK